MNPYPKFINGPLDAGKKPKKHILIFATDGVPGDGSKPDQVDRTIVAGAYALTLETVEGPVYEWKGPRE